MILAVQCTVILIEMKSIVNKFNFYNVKTAYNSVQLSQNNILLEILQSDCKEFPIHVTACIILNFLMHVFKFHQRFIYNLKYIMKQICNNQIIFKQK